MIYEYVYIWTWNIIMLCRMWMQSKRFKMKKNKKKLFKASYICVGMHDHRNQNGDFQIKWFFKTFFLPNALLFHLYMNRENNTKWDFRAINTWFWMNDVCSGAVGFLTINDFIRSDQNRIELNRYVEWTGMNIRILLGEMWREEFFDWNNYI